MKATIFSDLHLPVSGPLDYALDIPDDTDVVIVAGDVDAPVARSLKWLYEYIAARGFQVVFVAGNHEHYRQVYETSMAGGFAIRDRFPGVHFLENEETVIGGVRFLGATMWTDFNLYETPERSMKAVTLGMNDYRVIGSIDGNARERHFTAEMTRGLHRESRAWLEAALARPFDGKTVVVTHHCPHNMSVHNDYLGHPVNPGFTSDLSDIMVKYQPNLWVHGHTHFCFDYVAPGTRTRVVCNPRGYVWHRFNGSEIENRAFEPFKTIDI
jgi:Icc-related predicted phosphoesterase